MFSARAFTYATAAVALAGLAAGQTAHAQSTITTYSSQAAFNAAATVSGPYNFDQYVTPGNNAFEGSSFAFSPTGPSGPTTVTFTAPSASLYLDSATYSGGFYTNAFGTSAIDTNTGVASTLSMASPGITAFGAQFAITNAGATTGPITVMVFDTAHPGGIVAGTFSAPNSASAGPASYFGFTDSSQINGISYTGGATDVALSNFSYGTNIPSAAPEPSQFAGLSFAAFAVLGLILKARRKSTLAQSAFLPLEADTLTQR